MRLCLTNIKPFQEENKVYTICDEFGGEFAGDSIGEDESTTGYYLFPESDESAMLLPKRSFDVALG